MAIIQIGLFDDVGLGDARLASSGFHANEHIVAVARVKVAPAISPIIARAAEAPTHDSPKGALVKAANAALARQRIPVRLEIAQLTALVKRVDTASRDRVLELARQVGIVPVGELHRERSPLIDPIDRVSLRVGNAIDASAETDRWRMLG